MATAKKVTTRKKATPATATKTSATTTPEWKLNTSGFINLKNSAGKTLLSIPLKRDNTTHSSLIDLINDGTDIQDIVSQMQITFEQYNQNQANKSDWDFAKM